MPKYVQTIKFEREFVIEARDAAAANEKLEELIREVEWDSKTRNEGYYDFEDEPVQCPECEGRCTVGEDEHNCPRCKGEGSIPFVAA